MPVAKHDTFVIEYVEPGRSAEVTKPGVLYIERWKNDTPPDRAKFLCPCGCTELYDLNLDDDVSKHPHLWKFTVDEDGRPTIHPSVNFTAGCKSHFHLKAGKIQMC